MKEDYYSPTEERANIGTHAAGIVGSIAAAIWLVPKALEAPSAWNVSAVAVFLASALLLYSMSTIYHSSRGQVWRQRLRVLDHSAIFVLIAGTYTPFALVSMRGGSGWIIFAVVWSVAVLGIVFKVFFTGRFELFSSGLYVAMGWIIVFFGRELANSVSGHALAWLVAGGLSYTVGAVFYSIKRIPFNHAIFHVFVLGGTACHTAAVYFLN